MDTSKFTLLFPLFFLSTLIKPSSSLHACKPSSCSDTQPQIRFPFYIKNQQKDNCGYLGFGLSCNQLKQTIISLPASGDFLVSRIDYSSQAIYVDDPDYCLPKRLLSNFKLHGTPFTGAPGKTYSLHNCSAADWIWTEYLSNRVALLPCLENKNDIFLATEYQLWVRQVPASCQKIEDVSVPLKLSQSEYLSSPVLSEGIELIWKEPTCQACEAGGMYCGFINDTGSDVACYRPPARGLPRTARYAAAMGITILLAILLLTGCYLYSWTRNYGLRNNRTSSHPVITANPVAITGLDKDTIELYPKTVIGGSRRLPEISINACSICLCEYQPKDTLRTIPQCKHYFHVDCIDEWLKRNNTCPVCRCTLKSRTLMP